MEPLLTPADLAALLAVPEERVHELRRRHGWPCVRLGRKEIRFTQEQAHEIIERHTERPSQRPDLPLGAVPGQTRLSAARHRN